MVYKQTVYYGDVCVNGWHMYLAVSEKGLCYVGSADKGIREMLEWVKTKFPDADLVEAEEEIASFKKQFAEYFNGQRKNFTFPLDVSGTAFQKKVWKHLQEVPYGETVSYLNIAERIGNPRSVRAIGAAVAANPLLIVIPCHRVIRQNGAIGGYRGGISMKRELLLLEKNYL